MIRDLSGDRSGIGLVVYGEGVASLALSTIAWCAAAIVAEVAEDRTGDDCGFRGSGGGALSGSELSHLRKSLDGDRGMMFD